MAASLEVASEEAGNRGISIRRLTEVISANSDFRPRLSSPTGGKVAADRPGTIGGTADGEFRSSRHHPRRSLARLALDAHHAARRPRGTRAAARGARPEGRLTRSPAPLALLY